MGTARCTSTHGTGRDGGELRLETADSRSAGNAEAARASRSGVQYGRNNWSRFVSGTSVAFPAQLSRH